jgi:hypothetical protein
VSVTVVALTKEHRDSLPDDDFAVPETRDLPIHDQRHVRMAWSQVDRTGGLSQGQRTRARHRIIQRAHKMGIDTAGWVHAGAAPMVLEAMSLALPDVEGHPNRMPFSGVLTRVNEPSDEPPGGSGGKRVLIPKDVAEQALPTLLGMSVDITEDFSGHNAHKKIGLISEATISGNAIHIAGFLYAYDFPEECARIKAEKNRLGFSYECQVAIADQDADPWVVSRIVFTGAAILYKDKAAYRTTSLAAQAQEVDAMTPEELKKLNDSITALTTSVTAISEKVTKLEAGKGASLAGPIIDQVMPHVAACNAAADKMEAAGVGSHPQHGHAAHIRRVAAHMLQCAVAGHMPHIYRDHDYLSGAASTQEETTKAISAAVTKALEPVQAELKAAKDNAASLKTLVEDLKAQVAKQTPEPARKTVTPEVKSLIAKLGVTEDDAAAGKITVANIDKTLEAAGIKGRDAMTAKLKLQTAGLIGTTA